MNTNHTASLYGAIRILENVAGGFDVTLGDVQEAINDLYAIINDLDDAPSSSSANAGSDPMIFKFDDYVNRGNGGNFPKGVA